MNKLIELQFKCKEQAMQKVMLQRFDKFENDAKQRVKKIEQDAEKMASFIFKDAEQRKQRAEKIEQNANKRAYQLENEVKQRADKLEKNAKQQAGRIEKDAKQLADRIVKDANKVEKDAKQRADRIEKDANKVEKDAKQLADRIEKDANKVEKEAKQRASKIEKKAKQQADRAEKEAKQRADKIEKDANKVEKEAKQRASKIEKEAKQRADKIEKDANKVEKEAKQRASKIEKKAKQQADRAEKEAKQRASKIEKKAKQQADRAEKEAKQRASKIEKDANQFAEKKNQDSQGKPVFDLLMFVLHSISYFVVAGVSLYVKQLISSKQCKESFFNVVLLRQLMKMIACSLLFAFILETLKIAGKLQATTFNKFRFFFVFILIFVMMFSPTILDLSQLQSSDICNYFMDLDKTEQFKKMKMKTKASKDIYSGLQSYLNQKDHFYRILVISGYPGVGKSTAVQNFIMQRKKKKLKEIVVYLTTDKQLLNCLSFLYRRKDSWKANRYQQIQKILFSNLQKSWLNTNIEALFEEAISQIKQSGYRVILILDQLQLSTPQKRLQFRKHMDFFQSRKKQFGNQLKIVMVSTEEYNIENLKQDNFRRVDIQSNSKQQIKEYLRNRLKQNLQNNKARSKEEEQLVIMTIAEYSDSFRQAGDLMECAKNDYRKLQQCISKIVQQDIQETISKLENQERKHFLNTNFQQLSLQLRSELSNKRIINRQKDKWFSKIIELAIERIIKKELKGMSRYEKWVKKYNHQYQ